MVIVATGSDVRSMVIKELLAHKKVYNLLLEKVLFQTIEEYAEIETLLEKTQTKCWVNHPRRMFPFYQTLKEEFKGSKQLMYSVKGGAWGLGCNALHYIDHLSFFVDSEDLILSNVSLDNKIYDSKREGFIEFNGLLSGKINNHCFSLYSNAEGTTASLTISSEKVAIKINEVLGEVEIARETDGWVWKKQKEKIIYFQSELSQVVAEEILIKHKILLPTYAMAKALHVPFLECLLEKMEQISGVKEQVCSIT